MRGEGICVKSVEEWKGINVESHFINHYKIQYSYYLRESYIGLLNNMKVGRKSQMST